MCVLPYAQRCPADGRRGVQIKDKFGADKPQVRVFVGDKSTTGRTDIGSPIFGETLETPAGGAVTFTIKVNDEVIGTAQATPAGVGNMQARTPAALPSSPPQRTC
jgi:hypothetical protein